MINSNSSSGNSAGESGANKSGGEEQQTVNLGGSINLSEIEDLTSRLNVEDSAGGGGGEEHKRKHANQDTTTPEWFQHKKHVFIFSQSGKPIYSRYGDEVALNTFMASLSAMSSFVESQGGDTLRYLVAGKFQFVFLHKAPLVLVAISKTGEPHQIIATQLDYVHSLLVSILTQSNIKICIEQKYDLRELLTGAERFIDIMIKTVDNDLAILLNTVQCLRLNNNVRNSITNIISNHKSDSIMFTLMMTGNKLITLSKQKKNYILKPQDIHVLMTLVESTYGSLKNSESWIPICLPNFNDVSYLYMYISYIYQDICIIFFSAQMDSFHPLNEARKGIAKDIESEGLAEELKKAVKNQDYSVKATEVPHLLHFAYKSRSTQFSTYPVYSPPYSVSKEESKRLFRLYQHIITRVNSSQNKPYKYFYHTSQNETVIAGIIGHHELYATFSPLEKKSVVFESFSLLLQWVKENENNLFIN